MRIPLAGTVLAVVLSLALAGPAAADPPHPVPTPPPHAGEQGPPPFAGQPGPPPHAGVTPPPAAGSPADGRPGSADEAPAPAGPGAGVPGAERSNGNPTPGVRYPLCHATGSASNPYVGIEIALPGVVRGHAGHPDDIIPPIPGRFAGQNWPSDGIVPPDCEAPAARMAGAFAVPIAPAAPAEPGTAAPVDPAAPEPVELTTLALPSADPAGVRLAFTGPQLLGLLLAAGALLGLGGAAAFAARRAG